MKRFVLALLLCILPIGINAQIKIKEVQYEADTLIMSVQKGIDSSSILDLFKGNKGYLIRVNSTNMFDPSPSFYLGETKSQTIKSLIELLELCDNDVATVAIVEDVLGNQFYIRTSYMAAIVRKPTFVKSDRLHIKNVNMAGFMCLNKKTIEETIKLLGK